MVSSLYFPDSSQFLGLHMGLHACVAAQVHPYARSHIESVGSEVIDANLLEWRPVADGYFFSLLPSLS